MIESNRQHAHVMHIVHLRRLSIEWSVTIRKTQKFRLKKTFEHTANRKSPGDNPAMSATPPGSTSSKY